MTTSSLITFSLALLVFLGYHRRWRPMKLVTIIDGDTFIAIDNRGKRRKLRLRDVDCPEIGQKLGQEAKLHVKRLTEKKWVRVKLTGRDKYRRCLAHVRVGDTDVAHSLVREGLAHPLSSTMRLRFAHMGAVVRRKGVHGLWFQKKPWHHRRGKPFYTLRKSLTGIFKRRR